MIKYLNARPETIPLLHDIGCSDGFLDMTPKAQATKAKVDRRDHIKLQ